MCGQPCLPLPQLTRNSSFSHLHTHRFDHWRPHTTHVSRWRTHMCVQSNAFTRSTSSLLSLKTHICMVVVIAATRLKNNKAFGGKSTRRASHASIFIAIAIVCVGECVLCASRQLRLCRCDALIEICANAQFLLCAILSENNTNRKHTEAETNTENKKKT